MGVNQCGTGCTVCVFDSGIGGLNLLHACAVRCPGADFLYFADNFNMPYGELPAEKVRRFVFDAFKKIASFSPAAAVVACNTATALCIADLRAQYPCPVIGIQPAVKQAVERRGGCLVLATPATSASPSFARLCADYGKGRAQVLPCPGLAEYIERGIGAFPAFDGISRFLPRPDSERHFPREDFATAATLVLDLLKLPGEEVEVDDSLEAFLDAVCIYDLEARTDDRTDFSIAFWHADAPLMGFAVRCRLSPMNPLLDGGRTANLKFEQTGIKFAVPTVNKINALPEAPNEVADRMLMIERLGGVLKYADVADRVFRCNLLMIDLHFPRMLAE